MEAKLVLHPSALNLKKCEEYNTICVQANYCSNHQFLLICPLTSVISSVSLRDSQSNRRVGKPWSSGPREKSKERSRAGITREWVYLLPWPNVHLCEHIILKIWSQYKSLFFTFWWKFHIFLSLPVFSSHLCFLSDVWNEALGKDKLKRFSGFVPQYKIHKLIPHMWILKCRCIFKKEAQTSSCWTQRLSPVRLYRHFRCKLFQL